MIFDIEDYAPIPTDWTKVKLSDIAEFNKSAWSKKDAPEQIYYIDIASVSTAKMEPPTLMDFADAPSRARRKVESGDIIISTVRPNLKQFVLIDDDKQNLTASTGFCVISPKRKEYTWLIYSLISSDFFTEYLVRVAQGAAYPAIKPTDISDASIGLPPKSQLDTFNLLAGSLWLKETANIAMNQTLEKIAQRIFKSWFIDFDPVKANAEGVPFNGLSPELQALFPSEFEESELGMIPKGWKVKKISDAARVSTGKRPAQKVDFQDKENQIPVWGGNGIKWYTNTSLTEKPFIITGRVGTLGTVYKIFEKVWVSDNALTLTPKADCFDYLYNVLLKSDLQSLNSGSTQPLITQTAINNIKIVLPTEDVLRCFQNIVDSLNKKASSNEKEIDYLTKIRNNLLPRLISGKIILSDVNQELKETV